MQPRALTYRAEIIAPVLMSVAAGESCSIVGMSGVGKSNMVQQMLRPEVLRHHLAERAESLRFVIFDTNMLAEWSAWGFFEGLGEALLSSLGHGLPPDVGLRLRDAHQQMLMARGQYPIALRQCAEVLALLCIHWQIVLLFDEFDPLFAQLSGAVLRNLRGLRDRYKYRLMYLTFSRQPLTSLRDDDHWDEVEPFVELLTLRELGLQPLREEDATDEVARFASRHGRDLDTAVQARIVALSGGHPALLRALTQEALHAEDQIAAWGERLHRLPAIGLECMKIWQQMTGDEQDEVLRAARSQEPVGRTTQSVLLKGLLRPQPGGSLSLFSPLFKAYLTTMGAPPQGGPVPIHVDEERNVVYYYGRDISGELPPLEYRLLAYLWERMGHICSVAEVAAAIHPDEPHVYLHESSEFERVRTLARRLRRHLATLVPDQPVPLSIYRMRGYRLGILAEEQ